ncbi:MAG: hypothetical protein AB1489_29455 [Acidobacteriota bacterium]
MIYEYKLIPLDRRTGRPLACPMQTPACIKVDVDVLVPLFGKGGPENIEVQILAHTAARIFSEMFGADVFYREEKKEGIESEWKYQQGYVPSKASGRSQ